MDYLQIVGLFVLIAVAVQSATIPNKDDVHVFDPNLLMESYMGVRTDQSSYGSFHPNDLIVTIQNHFQNKDKQTSFPDDQWGLSLYNPNEAISQYVGKLNAPGALGPEVKQPEVGSNHGNQNQYSQITGFNPDELNTRLLNSIEKDNFSAYGFDADAVNKQSMKNMNTSQQQPNPTPSAIDQTKQSGTGTNNGPLQSHDGSGFDADQLNAKLLDGLKYDPNSVMSSTNNLQNNAGTVGGTTSGPISSTESSFPTMTTNVGFVTGNNRDINNNNMAEHNVAGSSGQRSAFLSGANAGITSNGIGKGNSAGFQAGGVDADGYLNQAISNSAGSIGRNSPYSSGSYTRLTANGIVNGTVAGFQAGKLGADGFLNQTVSNSAGTTWKNSPNSSMGNNDSADNGIGNMNGGGFKSDIGGNPPGVQTESDVLKQTGVVMQAPSGIGAIGGRLS